MNPKKYVALSALVAVIILTILFNLGDITSKEIVQYIPPITSQSQTAAVSDFNSSLIAHYTFDDTTNDSAGSNNGTAVGGPTYTAGKIGQALSFDGSNDYISSGLTGIPTSEAESISAWVKINSSAGVGTALSYWSDIATGGNFKIEIDNGVPSFYNHCANGGTGLCKSTGSALTPGVWYHLVGTSDGGSGTDDHLYVNGTLVADGGFWDFYNSGGTRTLLIGNQQSTSNYFNGSVDDVRIYNRVLSATEISQLYALGSGTTPVPDPTPTPIPTPSPTPDPVVVTPPPAQQQAPSSSSLQTFYIRDGGTSSICTDWANACDTLPEILTRGATYYIADGSYPPYTFDDDVSGSQYITIKKATVSDHGTNTGWNSTYGDGQALFASTCVDNWVGCESLVFRTSYWILDGSIGSGGNALNYGFSIPKTSQLKQAQHYVQLGKLGHTDIVNYVTLKNIAVTCSGSVDDTEQLGIEAGSYFTLKNSYVDNCQNSVKLHGKGSVIENNYFGRSMSTASHHGEHINTFSVSDFIFRNNFVLECKGTACIAVNSGGAPVALDDIDVYGNLFLNSKAGNGIIGGTSGGAVSNARVYNNTVINSGPILYQNNSDGPYGLEGNIVKNNLFYNSSTFTENGGGTIDHDYNAFYSVPNSPTEIHGFLSSGNPFVNLASGDYRLNVSLPGVYLTSLYNTDSFGYIRGADGAWDRGAYEYTGSVGTTLPQPPPAPVYRLGDFNRDGAVNALDFSLLSGAWNTNNSAYDLNSDSIVNTLDYVIMVQNWTG